ncbi:DNA-3-methyladenine glycosylase family protein [Candidatus Methanoperedens nitratireducens]|uniref:HhH-GPD family protein n=1 Tax=Candidatus Methanoperedens nitratireducens TaxID=1392998 RepID=A0A284VQ58_9EURY|nr:DNA-3-methyladenine glycosylase 2 [Candidatus Methanoperedens nitroreducens]SNQ61392.1 HhH-GPD family protein [Candidatus Methanoperedens nitroreducens]
MDSLSFDLKPLPPFRLDLTVWALRRRRDNTVDRWDGTTYRRVLVLDGKPVETAVVLQGKPDEPELSITATGLQLSSGTGPALAALLERMLGIRVDVSGFYRLAQNDTQLEYLASQFRGLKPPRFPTLFDAIVNGIACQQVSLTQGIRLLNKLVTACGKTVEGRDSIAYAFPQPEDIAGLEPEAFRNLGFSRQKARALLELSHKVIDEHVDIEEMITLTDEDALSRLCELRGVGRWTAEYVLLRGMGRLHVFPGDDSGARNKLQSWLGVEEKLDYKSVKSTLARWSPYGGFIYFHLLLNDLAHKGELP